MAGTASSARTTAYPIRWVNETLPPRPRRRWLLITMRLSISSLAGMSRTLVAVGTTRLLAMFEAVRAAVPRSRFRCPGGWLAAGCGRLAAGGCAAGRARGRAAGRRDGPGAAGRGGRRGGPPERPGMQAPRARGCGRGAAAGSRRAGRTPRRWGLAVSSSVVVPDR